MSVIKQYNTETSQWETIVIGKQGPQGVPGADGAQSDVGPTNQIAPVITGTTAEGSTLTVSNGGWIGVVPIEFTYQWQRVTTNISGATSNTYTAVEADVGNTLRCVVTATSAGGTANVNTANTAEVSGIVPANTVLPVITGTAQQGEVQTVSDGTWEGTTPLTFTFQWQRGTTNISGATSNTYTAVQADIGSTLRCVVTATNAVGSASVNTANTDTIIAAGPTVIGQAFGGGFFAGEISTTADSVATHYLIVGPLSTAQSQLQWKNVATTTPGALSDIDGPQNTAYMVAHGSSTVYPAAHFCNNLTSGGFSNWYMPARNELDVCYFNLKPTTGSNATGSGINPNAVPARASNYTSGNPARTSAAAFQEGGAEAFAGQAFDEVRYWSSTESNFSATNARLQFFSNGDQTSTSKTSSYRVRAVRRLTV